MDNNFYNLYEMFCKIKKMGWICSLRSGSTGVGYTFEMLLNKNEDNLFIADYNNIEIKTYRELSSKDLHLFNATPDGDYLFSIKRVRDILGYPDKVHPKFKILNMDFNAKGYTKVGYYKRAKIIINNDSDKIDLIAIDGDGKDLNVNVSWSYDLLKERLNLKLKYLAVVCAKSKFINNKEYFLYDSIKFYKLKSFDAFISLIKSGDVIVTFKIGVFKSGERFGQIHDRGTCFSINKEIISKLFDEIIL